MREFKINTGVATPRSSELESYLTDIRQYPLLTPQKEYELATKGDKRARNFLVKSNLRFVVSVAKRFPTPSPFTIMDLISEGNMGLIKAVEKFDPTRGFKLISFAIWWIRQHMNLFLQSEAPLIHVPVGLNKLIKQIYKDALAISADCGIEVNPWSVMPVLKLPETSHFPIGLFSGHIHSSIPVISLDAPVGLGDDVSSLLEILPDLESVRPDSVILNDDEELRVLFKEVIFLIGKNKNKDSAEMTLRYYGFMHKEGIPETLESIAKDFGCTRERVRQKISSFLEQLNNHTRAQELRSAICCY